MTLLELYKVRNGDPDWQNRHSSLGKGSAGKFFEYINTNFRTQKSFSAQFQEFVKVENKARVSWSMQEVHGQEVDKHRVVNMIQSKLFRRNADGIFSRTAKGIAYSSFLQSDELNEEWWLINYLFLLNGYYLNHKNYIIHRVKEDLLNALLSTEGLSEHLIIQYAKDLLKTDSFVDALRAPFFYLHSLYDDSDFLTSYLRADIAEREELALYIETNIQNETYNCCLSKKYKPSGNFNYSMLLDETKVFLLTLLFLKTKNPSITSLYEVFTGNYSNYIKDINKNDVTNYLRTQANVFEPIFIEVLEIDEANIPTGYSLSMESGTAISSVENDQAEDYIDETSEQGKQRIRSIFNLRKRQARIEGGYLCTLEETNNCKPVYFTAKATGENYLELHHLIPQEFRNDFAYSIEVLANYVVLCPRCHRQIHLAVDRERKHLINSLYNSRKSRLTTVGLEIPLKGLYSYYKIEI